MNQYINHIKLSARGVIVLLLLHVGGRGPEVLGQSAPSTRPLQLPLSSQYGSGVSVRESAPAPGAGSTVQIQVQGSYTGSVQPQEAVPETLSLTLPLAVQRALIYNLGVISSTISLQQATAQLSEARSALLPKISASLSEMPRR